MEGHNKLVLRNVCKSYGHTKALQGIDLSFSNGVYGLLGPNGAGKSTLMYLLTDCIRRDEGEILYEGRDILSLGLEYRRKVGYMPQSGGYYRQFTVWQFLSYMGYLKGMKKKASRERITELLEEMHLTDRKDTNVGGLSGGMRQRMMLVEALLTDPEILILDEPTAGVDPQERVSIRNYISKVAADKIVIIATHIVSDIEAIAGRIFLLKQGRVAASGTPSDLVSSVLGHTYEAWVPSNHLESIQKQYIVSGISAEEQGLRVKIITEQKPDFSLFHECSPNLEDVYLWWYRER